MEFEYFSNPKNFAYFIDSPKPCSICGEVGLWFDSGAYSGIETLECICTNCLKSGKLIPLEIEPNIVFHDGSEASTTIAYKTPSFPTWQDTAWPRINGLFPVFECIASKQDFKDKQDFLSSFCGEDQTISEVEWLWDILPDNKLNNYQEAGDISVYLFSLKGKKYWVWDAN